jgi:hypothetical protein
MDDYLMNVTLKDILARSKKQMFAKLQAGQDFSI